MDDILEFFGVMMSIMIAAGGGYVVIALASAWAKRLERRGGAADPVLEGEVARLRDRVPELGGAEERLAELEERLDFAERLLTDRGQPARLREPEAR